MDINKKIAKIAYYKTLMALEGMHPNWVVWHDEAIILEIEVRKEKLTTAQRCMLLCAVEKMIIDQERAEMVEDERSGMYNIGGERF